MLCLTWHTLFQAPTVSELTHRLRIENRRAQTPNIAVCIRVVDRKIVFRGGSVEFPVIVSESVDRSKKLTYKNRAAVFGQKNDCTIIADRKNGSLGTRWTCCPSKAECLPRQTFDLDELGNNIRSENVPQTARVSFV